jgi:hypothetical protein
MKLNILLITLALVFMTAMPLKVRNHMRAHDDGYNMDGSADYDMYANTTYDDTDMYDYDMNSDNGTDYDMYDMDGNTTDYDDYYYDEYDNYTDSYDNYTDDYDYYGEYNYTDEYDNYTDEYNYSEDYNNCTDDYDYSGDYDYDNFTDEYDYSDEYNYTDEYYGGDDTASYIEDLVYQAKWNLEEATSMWESLDYDIDYEDHSDDDHNEYYNEGGCPYGVFEGHTIEELSVYIEEQVTEHSDEYGNWEYTDGEDYAYGYHEDYEDGTSYGWAWDGSSDLTYYIDAESNIHAEMYDCNWNIKETWSSQDTDVAQINEMYDNDLVRAAKDLYNEGNHYNYDDGSVYFNDGSEYSENGGMIYPDGSGYVWFNDEETHEYTSVDFTCNGASGYYYTSDYDEDWNLESSDDGSWDNDCAEYINSMSIEENAETATEATEDFEGDFDTAGLDDGDISLEVSGDGSGEYTVAARTQLRSKLRNKSIN